MATAIILARGGSKGVPRKNLLMVGGKTLLGAAIEKCRNAETIDCVYVSSDDPEILSEASNWGAATIWRPAELATSASSSWDGLRHAIAREHITGAIAHVQCTNTTMTTEDIDGTMRLLPDWDMVACVVETHDLLVSEDARTLNWKPYETLRQHRLRQYKLAGSVWGYTDEYLRKREYWDGRVGFYITPRRWQVDIDTPDDVEAARAFSRAELWT